MASEACRDIDAPLGARHVPHKRHCVRAVPHDPRPDTLHTCPRVLPPDKVPLHVAIKVALRSRRDEPVVGDVVVPGRQVAHEGGARSADDDTVVARSLDQVVVQARPEAQRARRGQARGRGGIGGRDPARDAAHGHDPRPQLRQHGARVRVGADEDLARSERAARRRDGVVAVRVAGRGDGRHGRVGLEVEGAVGGAREGAFEEAGHELVGPQLAGGEGDGAQSAFDAGDARGERRVVDELDVVEVHGAVFLQLPERCFDVLGGAHVEDGVRGARQVEVAVDPLFLDEVFDRVELGGLVARD